MFTITEIKQKAKWTYADYEFLPADFLCEIINQTLYTAHSRDVAHQSILSNLAIVLVAFCRKNKSGTTIHGPLDVVLNHQNVVIPDIIFISKENSGIIGEKAIKGVPDLIVEVVSPGYVKYDREKKLRLYEKFGVKEYWIVKPGNELVEVLTLENKKYQQYSYAEIKGKVKSKIVKGFEVSLKEIFRKDF
ncbi:MAG: hypothetical protein JWO06_531 [Bacteroidota bacterium]|nr:hypothetical protein [Bacteroidota bacterium]